MLIVKYTSAFKIDIQIIIMIKLMSFNVHMHTKKCALNKNLEKKIKEYVINAVFTICRQEKLAFDSSMRAPFPPVCFTINAKPPAGYLYYFAYGPNMNPNRY